MGPGSRLETTPMSRRRLRRSAISLLLFSIILGSGVAASAEDVVSQGESFDRQLLQLRVVIAASCAALVLFGVWLDRRGGDRYRRLRSGLLAIFAVTAFCANFNFFLWPHRGGVHGHDVFHYYLGAKYFPELGYYDLYRCSFAAEAEGRPEVWSTGSFRDLRKNQMRRASDLRPVQERCDDLFSSERWTAFRGDAGWFHERLPGHRWHAVLSDRGFNPSPVWTLFGRPLAEAIDLESGNLRRVVRLDLLLLIVMFGVVGWCFGFQTMCLAVVFWGANSLSRYQWVGDSLLRYPWLVTSVIGVCLLYRSRDAAAGACLALATLLRMFPGFQIATYAVHQAREAWVRRALSPRTTRFVAGAVATAIVTILLSFAVTERGLDSYTSFAENISSHGQRVGLNTIGLRTLLSYSPEDARVVRQQADAFSIDDMLREKRSERFASRVWLYLVLLLVGGVLLWRALGRCEGWEAAAMGLVPALLILPMMSCYYLAAVVVMAPLSVRRPRIAVGTLLAIVAWGLGTLHYYGAQVEYVVASAVAVLLAFYILIEMQFAAPPDLEAGDDSPRLLPAS